MQTMRVCSFLRVERNVHRSLKPITHSAEPGGEAGSTEPKANGARYDVISVGNTSTTLSVFGQPVESSVGVRILKRFTNLIQHSQVRFKRGVHIDARPNVESP